MDMRATAATIAVALVALTSIAANAAPPPATVPCTAVVLRPTYLDGSHRFVLGRVAFSGTRVLQTADVGGDGSLRYASKALVFVRPGRAAVTVSVLLAWRHRAAIAWRTEPTHSLRFGRCPIPPNLSRNRWNGYHGAFFVREPACVPLRVRVGERTAIVRFGVGRAC